MKTQLVRDLCGVHGIWQILLVREDQQNLKTIDEEGGQNIIKDTRGIFTASLSSSSASIRINSSLASPTLSL